MRPWLPRSNDENATVQIRGGTFNRIMREIEAARTIRATAPLRAVVGPDGVVLSLGDLQSGNDWEWGQLLTGNSITSAAADGTPGTGLVTIEAWDGSKMVLSSLIVTVRNRYRDSVSGPKIVRVSKRGPGGLRWLLGVGCSPP